MTIPELQEYQSRLRGKATEEGAREAKDNLLSILKLIHDVDLLRKGGLVIDFINGVRIRFREDEGTAGHEDIG